MMISIITPTYNNSEGVMELFHTLKEQSIYNFEWIIIDDGSTLEQQLILKRLNDEQTPFSIRIFRQKNQGKHVALNYGFSKVKGEVTIIIDSDDRPLPKMIEIINNFWTPERLADPKLGIITFERGVDGLHPLQSLPTKMCRANYMNYRYKHSLYGDYAETFNSQILTQYRFPVFNHEKFLNEGFVLNDLGSKFECLFVDKIIYIGKYRSKGLTKNIREIEWNNPIGTFNVCKMELNAPYVSQKQLLKNIIKYSLFGLKNHIPIKRLAGNVSKTYKFFISLPISLMLYIVFVARYGK